MSEVSVLPPYFWWVVLLTAALLPFVLVVCLPVSGGRERR